MSHKNQQNQNFRPIINKTFCINTKKIAMLYIVKPEILGKTFSKKLTHLINKLL